MATTKRTDPVKVWFFVVLGAVVVASGVLIWVVSNGIHV